MLNPSRSEKCFTTGTVPHAMVKSGLGDGPKARMLDTFAGDFSGAFFQNQTDGEHFYKTKEGRDEMPGYDKKLTDEDIWNIVNYMRTFKK